MIPGLHGYATEYQLTAPLDLEGATIGVSAEVLGGQNSAEIVARLSGVRAATTSSSKPGAGAGGQNASKTGGNGEPGKKIMKFIVVFDGPARTTPSKLDDGLQRRRVLRTLVEASIPFIVAPGLAAAELAYLYEHQYISHVIGADEAMLWADVPIVIDLFTDSPQVLRRRSVLAHLRLGEAAFTEVVLGVGRNAITETALPLLDHIGNPIESAVRNAVQYGGPAPPPPPPPPPGSTTPPPPPPPSISVYRAALQACDPVYIAALQKALMYVWRQPVLGADGTVVLQNKTGQPVPNDLADVIGCQLAPEAYWYLNRGLLGPELLRAVQWGSFTDCYRVSANTPELHKMFTDLQKYVSPLRQQAYALLVSQMHRYFQVKEVVNRTDGGVNFMRTTPSLPQFTAPPQEGAGAAISPEAVVAAAIQHVRSTANLAEDISVTRLPEQLVRMALDGAGGGSAAPVLVRVASLVLREFVESVVCWFIATEKVPRSIDTNKLVLAMPWA